MNQFFSSDLFLEVFLNKQFLIRNVWKYFLYNINKILFEIGDI